MISTPQNCSNLDIEDLYDNQELIPVLAAWHLKEWPNLSADRAELLLSRISDHVLPRTFVAFKNGKPVGFASLTQNNLPERTDLSPWLTSLLIAPEARKMGVGQALVAECISYAEKSGYKRFFLHTTEAPDFYRRLGWTEIDQVGNKIVFFRDC